MTRILSLLAICFAVATALVPSSASACPKCRKADCCGPVCSYNPCIKYVDVCRCRKCCDCGPKVEAVLQVKDPVTCCMVDVPVCIPACCAGQPCIDAKVGAFGNGKVFYHWSNGYEIKVVLTKFGDITVVYLGHI